MNIAPDVAECNQMHDARNILSNHTQASTVDIQVVLRAASHHSTELLRTADVRIFNNLPATPPFHFLRYLPVITGVWQFAADEGGPHSQQAPPHTSTCCHLVEVDSQPARYICMAVHALAPEATPRYCIQLVVLVPSA
jgi:hypothetical protein